MPWVQIKKGGKWENFIAAPLETAALQVERLNALHGAGYARINPVTRKKMGKCVCVETSDGRLDLCPEHAREAQLREKELREKISTAMKNEATRGQIDENLRAPLFGWALKILKGEV